MKEVYILTVPVYSMSREKFEDKQEQNWDKFEQVNHRDLSYLDSVEKKDLRLSLRKEWKYNEIKFQIEVYLENGVQKSFICKKYTRKRKKDGFKPSLNYHEQTLAVRVRDSTNGLTEAMLQLIEEIEIEFKKYWIPKDYLVRLVKSINWDTFLMHRN